MNNENALTYTVIASNNTDGCDSFYSYEVMSRSPAEYQDFVLVGHHRE
jgi:hypothetical protein